MKAVLYILVTTTGNEKIQINLSAVVRFSGMIELVELTDESYSSGLFALV